VAPATDLERRVALIWSEALGRPEIARDVSFFDLGGNSLRATRLLAMAEAETTVRMTAQELYENPTVAGMAEILERRRDPG
jgi:acyl carrier protein